MEYGIALSAGADAWRWVQRAEALGFSHAWFYDTQMLCADPFVARIRLGTGVLIPSNRIAPVAANALASLNRLAPGRIVCGIGTGFTARRTMGLRAVKLAELREYVRVLRGLLAGELVDWSAEGRSRKIRFLNPELDLIDLDHPIPIHVGAMGPKARALAAEIGEGWINFALAHPAALADVRSTLEAWHAAGRDPADCHASGFTLGCILAEGETADSARARAQAGPLAAVAFHNLMESPLPAPLPPDLEALVARYREHYERYQPSDARYLSLHRGHLMFLRPEEEPLIGPDLIRNLTFSGTQEELRERLQEVEDAGYRQWVIQLVPGQEQAIEDWARLLHSG
jgi:5,10-methylenetetrahydromethanopterin reductase